MLFVSLYTIFQGLGLYDHKSEISNRNIPLLNGMHQRNQQLKNYTWKCPVWMAPYLSLSQSTRTNWWSDHIISLMSVCLQSYARGRCAVEWGPETLWGLPFVLVYLSTGRSNRMDVQIMREVRLNDGKVGWVGETICSLFLCYLSKAISTDSPAHGPLTFNPQSTLEREGVRVTNLKVRSH